MARQTSKALTITILALAGAAWTAPEALARGWAVGGFARGGGYRGGFVAAGGGYRGWAGGYRGFVAGGYRGWGGYRGAVAVGGWGYRPAAWGGWGYRGGWGWGGGYRVVRPAYGWGCGPGWGFGFGWGSPGWGWGGYPYYGSTVVVQRPVVVTPPAYYPAPVYAQPQVVAQAPPQPMYNDNATAYRVDNGPMAYPQYATDAPSAPAAPPADPQGYPQQGPPAYAGAPQTGGNMRAVAYSPAANAVAPAPVAVAPASYGAPMNAQQAYLQGTYYNPLAGLPAPQAVTSVAPSAAPGPVRPAQDPPAAQPALPEQPQVPAYMAQADGYR